MVRDQFVTRHVPFFDLIDFSLRVGYKQWRDTVGPMEPGVAKAVVDQLRNFKR